MNKFETTENLVDEGLEVRVSQRLAGANDGCQVAFHQLCRIINIPSLSSTSMLGHLPS